MAIRRLILENYRSFRERQEIELAPVTVILGKNNSGKSALVRLPLLLDSGLRTDSSVPLDLDRLGADAVNDFRELYFDQLTRRPLTLGLDVDGHQPFRLEADLEYIDSTTAAIVARLQLSSPSFTGELVSSRMLIADNGTRDIDGFSEDSGPRPFEPGEPLEYEVRVPGQLVDPHREIVEFRGLLPEWAGEQDFDPGPIRYLGPYREPVARQHRMPHGIPVDIGNRGQGLPALLAHDRERTGGRLLDQINERLASIVPGWRIDEVPAGPLRSTVLTRRGSKVRVNLADAGSGLAQVLPIIAQCAMDDLYEGVPRAPLQIIEEPELHLHPAAHADLADLYLATAQATGTRFLIETHSETLLLRLRLRVAETANKISPDTVAIYVVEQNDGESIVRRVHLDDLGNLDDSWPHGYFSQDYHEVRALAAAQRERRHRAS